MPPLAAAAPFIGAGVSALGSILGNKKSARTQEQSSTSTQTSTPNLSPSQQNFQNLLMENYANRINQGLPEGLEERGIMGINETRNLGEGNLASYFASHGLAGSPGAASALGQNEIGRYGDIGRFRSSLPALEDEMQRANLANAASFFGMMPYGQTVTGESSGTAIMPGSAVGAGFSDLGGTLGLFSGLGMFGPDPLGTGANLGGGTSNYGTGIGVSPWGTKWP